MPARSNAPNRSDPPSPERLIALSATFRDLPTDARERLASTLTGLEQPFDERVVVHTCHRVELFGLLRPGQVPPRVAEAGVREGPDAAERAFLVAGGLDSVVLAEEQVLGQVRSAYEEALVAGETGPILNELLRRAIRFGKRVRSEARPKNDRSLAERAVRWLTELLGPEGRPASALVLGSGEMGRLLARLLVAEGMTVTVASRSLERAEGVLEELPPRRHRALELDAALRQVSKHDVVAVAVRSSSAPLDRGHLAERRPPPLVVDLSAPPAVTRAAADLLGDRLLDLDRLGSLSSADALSARAERRLREAAAEGAASFIQWWSARPSGDGIALLRNHADAIRQRHLARLRRRGDFTPQQLTAVESATAAMLGELLHAPTRRLQRDADAGDIVTRIFGLSR